MLAQKLDRACATASRRGPAQLKPVALRAEPEVLQRESLPPLKWGTADEDGLVKFLVEEKSFSEERIRKVVEKINAARSKATQGRATRPARTALPPPCSTNAHQGPEHRWCRAPGVLLRARHGEVVDGGRQAEGPAQSPPRARARQRRRASPAGVGAKGGKEQVKAV